MKVIVLIKLLFAILIPSKAGGMLIPTIILPARCLVKLVGMALAMLCILALSVQAQESGSIRGKVTDAESKRPLAGANVLLEGTSFGASTREDGGFIIKNVPIRSYTLVVSFVGYTTQRVPVVLSNEMVEVAVTLTPSPIQVNPIIVTANAAHERETPVTFSSLKSKDIRDVYFAQDAPAVLSELPSLVHYSWNGNDMGYTFINLRGFDQRRLAVMVNGVPQNDPEDHNVYWIDMPDLLAYTENIQVQRGAGSSFYGPPAIGGSINIVTTPVSTQPKISLTSVFGFQEFGDLGRTIQNTRKYGLALQSGLIDGRYMLFANLSSTNSSGYRENSWIDLKSYFLGAAKFDETMTTRVHIYGGPLSDGLSYNGIPKFYNGDPKLRRINYNYFSLNDRGDEVSFATLRKRQEVESFSQPHYELLHEWRLSPTITLHNTLFYIKGEGFFDYDGDWVWFDPSATPWFQQYVGFDSTYGSTNFNSMILRGFVGNDQWGWLPRLEMKHEKGTVAVGGELRIHRSTHWGKIEYASSYPNNYDPDFRFYDYNGEKDMISLYGHVVQYLSEKSTLLADLQLTYNRYGIKNEKFLGTSFSTPYFFVNPRLGVNYNMTDEMNGYLSFGWTSREPRLRNLYAAEDAWFGAKPQFEAELRSGRAFYNFDKPLAKPERLLNVELGGGYTTNERKMTANVFWMEFTDELIKSGKVDIFGAPVTGNAERTRHLGVEVTISQRLNESFDLSGNATYSHNRLVRYSEFDAVANGFIAYDGNPIAGFPDVLGNLRVTYHTGTLMVSFLGKHVGSFYTDNRKDERNKVDAYTVFDLDAAYEVPRHVLGVTLTTRAKVRNLFNKLYMASGEGKEFFPAAERNYFVSFTVDL